jgi:CelD/BcsL family acetyltransferase involved in cellulose biosynthesis
MIWHAMAEGIREGMTAFDFLRGAEEYKYRWGAKDRVNRRRVWRAEQE